MGSLGAVEPNWLLVLHFNGESSARRAFFGRYKSRKESAICEWMTRVGKGRLNDRVVFGEEVELDFGANLGMKGGRIVCETIFAHSHFDYLLLSTDRRGGQDERSYSELHGEKI